MLEKIPYEDVACSLHIPVGGVLALAVAAGEGSATAEFVVDVAALATRFAGVRL